MELKRKFKISEIWEKILRNLKNSEWKFEESRGEIWETSLKVQSGWLVDMQPRPEIRVEIERSYENFKESEL